MIIDGLVTLSGLYDWTGSAAANPENLNLLSSPRFAEVYAAQRHARLALSAQFHRREDWCRS